uniref:LRAT domain-containing protein n=1 Tax=Strongyloides papillosus TaxID=174720 RepID=A0A0N5BI19_STREA
MDKECMVIPPEFIHLRVLSKIGKRGYNVLFQNCEHFVKWAGYNLPTSGQANIAKAIMIVGGFCLFKNRLLIASVTTILGYLGLQGYDSLRKLFSVYYKNMNRFKNEKLLYQ